VFVAGYFRKQPACGNGASRTVLGCIKGIRRSRNPVNEFDYFLELADKCLAKSRKKAVFEQNGQIRKIRPNAYFFNECLF